MLAYSESNFYNKRSLLEFCIVDRIETVSHTINAPIDCIQRIFGILCITLPLFDAFIERNISQIEGQLRADADFGIIDHFVETFKMPQSYNQVHNNNNESIPVYDFYL